MSAADVLSQRPVFLTREGDTFRMAFEYNPVLIERMRKLPYARFAGETKSWTCLVCAQSVAELRQLHREGFTDVSVDTLIREGEVIEPCKLALIRAGSIKRPFVVMTAFRDDTLYSRLRSIPSAQWEKDAGGVSFNAMASTALAELVSRGVIEDPDRLLSPAAIVVSFDGRTGKFSVRGDERAGKAFEKYFPAQDVVTAWQGRDIDVAFSDPFSEEVYRGEIARAKPGGLVPEGMKMDLFPYQAETVAVASERTGLGIFDAPGLGKTCSAIASAQEVMVNRGLVQRTVMVVPGAVRTQWKREITKFLGVPEDEIVVIEGDKKKRATGYLEAAKKQWLILHYDVLHLDYKAIAPLVTNALLVADEAHRCFSYDTKVMTRAGELEIGEIVENRIEVEVAAWDHETGGQWKKITEWMSSPAPEKLVRVIYDNGAFDATPEHPVWSEDRGEYVAASELLVGEHLRLGSPDQYSDLTEVIEVRGVAPESEKVYNLEVEDLHNYFAGGVLVHNCKSPTAKRTKAMRLLAQRASRRLALTGTPVENNPGEWYSVLSGFAVPGALGSASDFLSRYSFPSRWGGYEGARNLGELRERSKVHYVRKTKAEVATHLPPLRVQHLPLDPDPALAAALKRAHRDARDEIAQAAVERAQKMGADILDGELYENLESGAEMTAVGMLRLMTCSPRLVAESDAAAAKAMRESGLVPEVDGPKLDELRIMAAEMQSAGERLVVFTFSKKMANLTSERLTEDGVRHVMFTGDTSNDERDAAVTAFTTPPTEDDPGPTVFLATDAGAEGLNLGRCCSTLVNLDIPWTSSRMIQRVNRIHRIDGTAPRYLVINMTLRNTVEEGILRMVEVKADLSDAIFGEEGSRYLTTGRGRRSRSVFEEALAEWAGEPIAASEEPPMPEPGELPEDEPPMPEPEL